MSAVIKQQPILLRPMTAKDLPAVLAIEEAAYQFPWSEKTFHDCLQNGYCSWLLVTGDDISGYAMMSIYVGEAHILNLCIKPMLHNRGLGCILLEYLLELAKTHHADKIFLEVRPSNSRAIGLYKKLRFDEIGIRKDYYPSYFGREDALILTRPLLQV